MGHNNINTDRTTTYKVNSGSSFSTMSCVDKCLNKAIGCKFVIAIACFICCLIILACIAVGIAAIVIYETNDSSDFEDCDMANYKNVYYSKSGNVNNFCLTYYNISKVFNIGNDIDIVADCTFEIYDDEDQLIINKFNQTNTIIQEWSDSGLNILVTDKHANSAPAVLFAYLLSIGYSYDDSEALLNKIDDVDISYNFMQQVNIYWNYLQNGEALSDKEMALLWSNTNNVIVCMDI